MTLKHSYTICYGYRRHSFLIERKSRKLLAKAEKIPHHHSYKKKDYNGIFGMAMTWQYGKQAERETDAERQRHGAQKQPSDEWKQSTLILLITKSTIFSWIIFAFVSIFVHINFSLWKCSVVFESHSLVLIRWHLSKIVTVHRFGRRRKHFAILQSHLVNILWHCWPLIWMFSHLNLNVICFC